MTSDTFPQVYKNIVSRAILIIYDDHAEHYGTGEHGYDAGYIQFDRVSPGGSYDPHHEVRIAVDSGYRLVC